MKWISTFACIKGGYVPPLERKTIHTLKVELFLCCHTHFSSILSAMGNTRTAGLSDHAGSHIAQRKSHRMNSDPAGVADGPSDLSGQLYNLFNVKLLKRQSRDAACWATISGIIWLKRIFWGMWPVDRNWVSFPQVLLCVYYSVSLLLLPVMCRTRVQTGEQQKIQSL